MKNQKEVGTFALFLIGLGIFTFIVFHLTVGWFTIVMSLFVAIIFVLILLYPDEEKPKNKS